MGANTTKITANNNNANEIKRNGRKDKDKGKEQPIKNESKLENESKHYNNSNKK